MSQDQNAEYATQRFLEFNLGSNSYAVDLLKVKEVITPPELSPIPKAPHYVCGLMNLRGLILTVIDLRKKMGINPLKETSENGVIILDLGERLVGVMVDSIQKVVTLSNEQIKPVPANEELNAFYLKGVLHQEEKMCLWLDPNLIIDSTDYKKTA